MKKNELNELQNLLEYLQDKVEDSYKSKIEGKIEFNEYKKRIA